MNNIHLPHFAPHLQSTAWVQLSISECQQGLEHDLLGEGPVTVSCSGRMVKGKQEAAADYKPLWEDVRGLIERLTNAAGVIVQQPAVQLREKKQVNFIACVLTNNANMCVVESNLVMTDFNMLQEDGYALP